MKMRYSIEPRDRKYVNRNGFLSFAKNIGKNLSNKYGQKRLDSTKKSATDPIADKIISVWKKSTKELRNNETEEDIERATHKKR